MRTLSAHHETSLAASLAAEDVACGDYVAILSEVCELPSCFWCSDATMLPPDEPVRIRFLSHDGGTPLKVKAVCLPFVFVKSPSGTFQTLDVRRQQLAKLDRKYAAEVFKRLRPKTKRADIL
jgi:hypothetical protein